jgi:hypothetical protein
MFGNLEIPRTGKCIEINFVGPLGYFETNAIG